MRFYLSSYRLGNNCDELARLVTSRKRVGVIRNALDFSDDLERQKAGWEREFVDLERLGFTPQPIDLKEYFSARKDIRVVIDDLEALWIVGGNSFILNSAFHQSGLDKVIAEMLGNESFVYAGYSAGICILAPTLKGIHLADEPDEIPAGYPNEVIWNGLGVLPFCIAPHWRSDHRESSMIDETVEYFLEHKMPFIALRDGETYVTEITEMPSQTERAAQIV